MNKLNTKLLIGYILLGALIIAVAREYGFFAFVILVGFLVFVLYRKRKCRRQERSNALLNKR